MPEKEVWHTELPWGHGVVWDEERKILWALAISELRAYRLETDPGLEMVWSLELPESGAHELSPVPGSALLMLTTEEHCWVFDREARRLRPHPELGEAAHVKSLWTVDAEHRAVGVCAGERDGVVGAGDSVVASGGGGGEGGGDCV